MNSNIRGLIALGILILCFGGCFYYFYKQPDCIKITADGSVHCSCEFNSRSEWNKFKDNTKGLNHDGWEAVGFANGYDPCKAIKEAYKSDNASGNGTPNSAPPTDSNVSSNTVISPPPMVYQDNKIADSNKQSTNEPTGENTDEPQDIDHVHIAEYDQAIKNDPTYYFNYDRRGLIKLSIGDYQGAIADFSKVIELKPRIVQSYVNRGDAKNQLKDYNGAIIDYSKAIELSPNEDNGQNNSYLLRGNVEFTIQDYQNAINDYTTAIIYHPNNDIIYFNRAVAKHQINDNDNACLDWRKALDLGNKDAADMISEFCNQKH